jgi:CAAX prenyl protease-like protein
LKEVPAEISNPERPEAVHFSNFSLLVPYFAPYSAYVVIAGFGESLPQAVNYAVRLVVVTAVLFWAWRWYIPLTGPKNALGSICYGSICGIAGMAAWVLLTAPFAPASNGPWDNWAFALRLISATAIVPVFEELLMRGYVFRLAYQWDCLRKVDRKNAFHTAFFEKSIDDLEAVPWSIPAIALCSMAFAAGHQLWEWPAALFYGALMCALNIIRKDMVSCIAAHATTNLSLGLYVYWTEQWQYW